MNKNKNNRLNNIIKDLSSNDNKTVLTALKQLRKHGKPEAIKPLADLLLTSESDEISTTTINLLYDLKDQNVVDELMLCIEDEKYDEIKPILVAVFWQSKLDGSNYISSFVREAIKGDYMTAIEVMTVIDNFDEATFNEEEIINLKYDLDETIVDIKENDLEKAKLLDSIKSSLDNLTIEY